MITNSSSKVRKPSGCSNSKEKDFAEAGRKESGDCVLVVASKITNVGLGMAMVVSFSIVMYMILPNKLRTSKLRLQMEFHYLAVHKNTCKSTFEYAGVKKGLSQSLSFSFIFLAKNFKKHSVSSY